MVSPTDRNLLSKEAHRLTVELLKIAERRDTFICQEVADKVREIRKTRLMEDDVFLNELIFLLAQKGYFTV